MRRNPYSPGYPWIVTWDPSSREDPGHARFSSKRAAEDEAHRLAHFKNNVRFSMERAPYTGRGTKVKSASPGRVRTSEDTRYVPPDYSEEFYLAHERSTRRNPYPEASPARYAVLAREVRDGLDRNAAPHEVARWAGEHFRQGGRVWFDLGRLTARVAAVHPPLHLGAPGVEPWVRNYVRGVAGAAQTPAAPVTRRMRARVNPMRPTDLNLDVMLRALREGNGVIPERVRPSQAPHLKRCILAGLLKTTPGGWVPTAEGERALEDYLTRWPTRANPRRRRR